MIDNKVYGLLGLARRAGKISFGTESSIETIQKGKAKLVIVTTDSSDRTKNNFEELSKKYDEVIVSCLVKNKSNEFYKRMNCTKISFCEFILDGNSYEENLYTVNLK